MAVYSRPSRNVAVKFGPITVGVGLIGAVEDEDPGLVSICQHPGGRHVDAPPSRIRRRDFCPVCDNDQKSTFAKGKPTGSGVMILDAAAMEALAVPEASKKEIDLKVHPAAQMTRAFPTGKSYYLQAQKGEGNNYALLARLLTILRDEYAWIGEYSFGGAPNMYHLVVLDGTLALRQLARPSAVREKPEVNDGLVNQQYLGLGQQLAAAIVVDYDPANYADGRLEKLDELLGSQVPVALAGDGPRVTVDLAAALTAMIAANAPAAAAKPPGQRAPRKPRAAASTKRGALRAVDELAS
jgi:non-homologous end joining protein Ku